MLKVWALIVSVALLIVELIIHSWIGLSIDWNVDSWNLMVGCTMLVDIHFKFKKLKSSPLQPFGGLNIMFLGTLCNFHL
jgi:hypothetical protein